MKKDASETSFVHDLKELFGPGRLQTSTDQQLLEQFTQQQFEASEAAFATLVERYGPMVLGVCRRVVRDEHLAEDAAQATFLILAHRAKSIRQHASLGGWLHRVAHRVALRARRYVAQVRQREHDPLPEVAGYDPDRLERLELRAIVDQEIDRLEDSRRLPIVLCYLHGLSHEEAAAELKCPVGTLKSRLVRARQQLQGRLERRGVELSVAGPAGLDVFGDLGKENLSRAFVDAIIRAASLGVSRETGAQVSGVVRQLVQDHSSPVIFVKTRVLIAVAMVATLSAIELVTLGNLAWLGTANVASAKEESDLPSASESKPVRDIFQKPAPVIVLSPGGRVVDAAGKPVSGADVYLRESSLLRLREVIEQFPRKLDYSKLEEWVARAPFEIDEYERESLVQSGKLDDVLAHVKTDENGRFQFPKIPAPGFRNTPNAGKGEFPWDLIVLAPGRGLTWVPMTPGNQHQALTVTMLEEDTLRGRMVDPQGKPVADARVAIRAMSTLKNPNRNPQSRDEYLDLLGNSIPLSATTDADGWFQLSGLPREFRVALSVKAKHFHVEWPWAATTKRSLPSLSGNIREGSRIEAADVPVHSKNFVLTLKPRIHRLRGRVILEQGDKPVAGATVISMIGGITKTDERGYFEFDRLPAGPMALAIATWSVDAAPLETEVAITEDVTTVEKTFRLPPGIVLEGRVTDKSTGVGIRGVKLSYQPDFPSRNVTRTFVYQAETQADGRYRIVAPSLQGTLQILSVPAEYPPLILWTIPSGHDPGWKRRISDVTDAKVGNLDFRLERGRHARLQVVDASEHPVANATAVLCIGKPHLGTIQSTNSDGLCEFVGLPLECPATIDFLDKQERSGARVVLPANTAPNVKEPVPVVLRPLGAASGRVLDEHGKPIKDAVISVTTYVDDAVSKSRSGIPLPIQATSDGEGHFIVNGLLDGAMYSLNMRTFGYEKAIQIPILGKSGHTIPVPDFRLEVYDRSISAVIVDSRGKPVADVSVSLLSKSGRTVHVGVTDSRGRVVSKEVPRGPWRFKMIRLSLAQRSEGRPFVSSEINESSSELRIVMPN